MFLPSQNIDQPKRSAPWWRKTPPRLLTALCLVLIDGVQTPQALASDRNESQRCDLAAERAAQITGVPIDLLLAISRVETGRSGPGPDPDPWPWTINADGQGHWYGSKEAAVAAATAHLSDGTKTFDVGCFQLNIRWHGAGFATIDEMFDPMRNAEYAAGFLLELYRESGDWRKAVAAYHSRTPDLAQRYLSAVRAVLERPPTSTDNATHAPEQRVAHENHFPLLQSGGAGSAGSLVPIQAARGPLIGGNS